MFTGAAGIWLRLVIVLYRINSMAAVFYILFVKSSKDADFDAARRHSPQQTHLGAPRDNPGDRKKTSL